MCVQLNVFILWNTTVITFCQFFPQKLYWIIKSQRRVTFSQCNVRPSVTLLFAKYANPKDEQGVVCKSCSFYFSNENVLRLCMSHIRSSVHMIDSPHLLPVSRKTSVDHRQAHSWNHCSPYCFKHVRTRSATARSFPVPRNGVTVLTDVITDDVEGEKEREAAALLLQRKGFEP